MGRNDTMTALFGSCACFLLLPQRGKFVRRSIAAAVAGIRRDTSGGMFVCILFAVLVTEPLSWRLERYRPAVRDGGGHLGCGISRKIMAGIHAAADVGGRVSNMDVTAPALLRALMGRDVQGFVHQGGILFSLLIAALVAAALILGNSLRYGTYKGNYVSFLALATLSQGLFLFLYLGTQTTQLIVVLPWLMIWLAIALSRLR